MENHDLLKEAHENKFPHRVVLNRLELSIHCIYALCLCRLLQQHLVLTSNKAAPLLCSLVMAFARNDTQDDRIRTDDLVLPKYVE